MCLSPVVAGHPRWLPDADSLCDVRLQDQRPAVGWRRARRDAGEVAACAAARALIAPRRWSGASTPLGHRGWLDPCAWLSLSAMGTSRTRSGSPTWLAPPGLRPGASFSSWGPRRWRRGSTCLTTQSLTSRPPRKHRRKAPDACQGEPRVVPLGPLNRLFPNRSRISRWTRFTLLGLRLDFLAAARLQPRLGRPSHARPGRHRLVGPPAITCRVDQRDRQFAEADQEPSVRDGSYSARARIVETSSRPPAAGGGR